MYSCIFLLTNNPYCSEDWEVLFGGLGSILSYLGKYWYRYKIPQDLHLFRFKPCSPHPWRHLTFVSSSLSNCSKTVTITNFTGWLVNFTTFWLTTDKLDIYWPNQILVSPSSFYFFETFCCVTRRVVMEVIWNENGLYYILETSPQLYTYS